MNALVNLLACALAMLPAPFLWQGRLPLPLRGAVLGATLLCFEVFSVLSFGNAEPYALYEMYPLEMFALCLCVSTLLLKRRRAFFAALAQGFWLWVEFFGRLSLSYRNVPFDYLPLALLVAGLAFSPLLNVRRFDARLYFAVFWAGVWIVA